MSQRLVASLAVLAACFAAGCDAGPAAPPRNLVIVSLDTLRADSTGLHGYARATSPQLDRWAKQTFVFDNAVAPSNYTLASHVALFQSQSAGVALKARYEGPTLALWLKDQGFRTAAFTGGGYISQINGFERGFDNFDEVNPGLVDAIPKALSFLDEAARGEGRNYLFVHCFDVHVPYDPQTPYDTLFAPGYRGWVTGKDTKLLIAMTNDFGKRKSSARHPQFDDAADREKVRALYDGEIAQMDATLAPLLTRLDKPDLRGDTLVVILSDHGDEFWDHGAVLHSHTLYQEMLHVLLLMRVPGMESAAHRISQRVSLVDVLPTLFELLALPTPPGLRGRSLVPLLRGETPPVHPVFAEGFTNNAKLQAVIDGDWKLIRDLGTGGLSLYDLSADPGERSDLAQTRPEERERLRALLDAGLAPGDTDHDPAKLPADIDAKTTERLRELGYVE